MDTTIVKHIFPTAGDTATAIEFYKQLLETQTANHETFLYVVLGIIGLGVLGNWYLNRNLVKRIVEEEVRNIINVQEKVLKEKINDRLDKERDSNINTYKSFVDENQKLFESKFTDFKNQIKDEIDTYNNKQKVINDTFTMGQLGQMYFDRIDAKNYKQALEISSTLTPYLLKDENGMGLRAHILSLVGDCINNLDEKTEIKNIDKIKNVYKSLPSVLYKERAEILTKLDKCLPVKVQ